jgi:hypothetical protein
MEKSNNEIIENSKISIFVGVNNNDLHRKIAKELGAKFCDDEKGFYFHYDYKEFIDNKNLHTYYFMPYSIYIDGKKIGGDIKRIATSRNITFKKTNKIEDYVFISKPKIVKKEKINKDKYDNFITYYIDPFHRYICYDHKKKKISKVDKLPTELSTFFVLKGFEATDEALIEFNDKFMQWDYELRNNKSFPIYYSAYFNHYSAVENLFVKLLDKDIKKLIDKDCENFITYKEMKWFRSCNNGGLSYVDVGKHKVFGYDFKSFYPNLMSREDLKIPITQGVEMTLTELPKKRKDIQFGIYRVKITCNNDDFSKLFNYSKANTYTNHSLYQAYKYKKTYNIEIELIKDNKPNALIYDEYLTGHQIFGEWHKTLFEIKNKFPDNKLVKHLGSSLWGTLTRANTTFKTKEEIINENMDVGTDEDSEWVIYKDVKNKTNEYLELQSSLKPYKWNIRLMPFLISFGRNKTSELVINDIDNVKRVMCDNVCFTEEQDISNFENLILEDKTTGYFDFLNVLHYDRLDNSL